MLESVNYFLNSALLSAPLILSMSAALVTLVLLFFTYRKVEKMQQKINRLQNDLLVSNRSAIGMGQQLIELEKHVNAAKNTNSSPAQAARPSLQVVNGAKQKTSNSQHVAPKQNHTDTNTQADTHQQCRQLLLQGHAIEVVANHTGLSISEVSLINAMLSVPAKG